MSRKRPFPSAILSIDALHQRSGFGVGTWKRADGELCKVEVPFSMPGDKVEVQIGRRRRGYYQGMHPKIVFPSPERQESRCKHFGVCGGCRWQHLSYEQQCRLKQQQIDQLFAAMLDSQSVVESLVPCEPPWAYRNKMEFSFSMDAAGSRYLGLMMQGGRQKVVNITECHLVTDWFSQALNSTREWWKTSQLEAYHPHRDTGALRTLTLREAGGTGDRLAFLTLSGNPDYAVPKQELNRWVEALVQAVEPKKKSARLSVFIRIQQTVRGKPTQFYEVHLFGPDHLREDIQVTVVPDQPRALQCKISPTAFFQPNWRMAGQLYSTALQMVPLPAMKSVWDLYCGTGLFSMACAPYVGAVEGLELAHESILDARVNAQQNGLQNVEFTVGDVGAVLPGWMEEKGAPDLVLVDPPRAGLEGVSLQHVASAQAPCILYVSCNPKTQASDVQQLIRSGYRIARMRAVDQFPQTVHVENIVVLKKNKS